MQGDFFLEQAHSQVLDFEGKVDYYPHLLSGLNIETLIEEISFKEKNITLFGKTHKVPRLSAFYADDKFLSYTYSGIKMVPDSWPSMLKSIKNQVELKVGAIFNSALVNLYRDGADYAAWHSDDEKELDANSCIVSLSIGDTRKFTLMHKKDKGVEKVTIDLSDGDLLVMQPPLQKKWKHQLNKTAKHVGPRINITFRNTLRS